MQYTNMQQKLQLCCIDDFQECVVVLGTTGYWEYRYLLHTPNKQYTGQPWELLETSIPRIPGKHQKLVCKKLVLNCIHLNNFRKLCKIQTTIILFQIKVWNSIFVKMYFVNTTCLSKNNILIILCGWRSVELYCVGLPFSTGPWFYFCGPNLIVFIPKVLQYTCNTTPHFRTLVGELLLSLLGVWIGGRRQNLPNSFYKLKNVSKIIKTCFFDDPGR